MTYYCCVKQGIRLIDKTDGDELEINLGYFWYLFVGMKFVL